MRVSLIGGMDRLQKHYLQEAEKLGVDLRIFTRSENNMEAKIGHSQAVVIFARSKVSHQARNQAVSGASTKEIPVYMSHNCGVCALRDCIISHAAAGCVDLYGRFCFGPHDVRYQI